jgi:hypothetical protein
MSKAVSRGQALEVSGRFATQIDWDQLDGQKLQEEVIGLSPEEFGRRFTAFLKAGVRFSFGGLKVATAPFDLAKFIGEGWSFWKGPKDGNGLEGEPERDKTSAALKEVDFEKADLLTCLEKGESSITGEEKLVRLRKLGHPLYGTTQFMGLWQDYQQNKSGSVLERLYQQKGVTYVDFFGDILRDPNGVRCVLYLYRSGDGLWDWYYGYWLGSDWGDHNFSLVAQQVSS